MADVKWSDDAVFIPVGSTQTGDEIMGLRSGANVKFSGITPTASLQQTYNNGSDAKISLSTTRPVQIVQGSEQVNFNDTTTSNNLIFGVVSTTRASHPFPSMTTSQRLAITSPSIGDVVNDTDKGYFYRYNSSQWMQIVTNLPGAPVQNLSNSSGFPNISLGNPPRYYYTLNFTVNGILSLPNATSVNAVRPGFPIFLNNPSDFVVTVGDAGGNDLFIMNPGEFYMIQLDDNSTSNGVWVWTNLSQDTLQTAYDNSDGSILETSNKPFVIKDMTASGDNSSVFDVFSNTKGSRPIPSMTTTQRDAISSPATGLTVYNSTTNTIDYFDSVAWQIGLTIDHLIAGSNITLTQNGDGTVTIDATGSAPGNDSYYAGWSFQNGGTSTTFGAVDTYVPIIAGGLNDILSSSFVNEIVSISGHNTPCFRYVGSTTQYFEFNFNLFARGAVASQKTFQFQISIQRADTSIVQTGFVSGNIVLQDLIFPYAIPLSGIAQLNTGDRVYISVQNKTDTSSVVVQACNADILNVDATEQVAMVWNNVTGTSASMSPNNGYIANNGALVSLALPTTCNVGSLIQINGFGAGGYQITQGTGQQIFYESASTALGATGTLSSTNSKACVSLRCVVDDTVFQVENTTGSITLA